MCLMDGHQNPTASGCAARLMKPRQSKAVLMILECQVVVSLVWRFLLCCPLLD